MLEEPVEPELLPMFDPVLLPLLAPGLVEVLGLDVSGLVAAAPLLMSDELGPVPDDCAKAIGAKAAREIAKPAPNPTFTILFFRPILDPPLLETFQSLV